VSELLNLPTGKLQYGPYSPSRLEVATCGYAFHKQYIDPNRKKGKDRGSSLAADRGSVVHEVFERMNEQMMAGNYAFDQKVVRKWVSDAIQKYSSAYEDMEMIMECVRLYADRPVKNLPSDAQIEQKLALNSKLEECDYDSPDALIRGRADLLWFDEDLRAHILDYKTQPNIEEADTFQMGIYALVIARTFKVEEVYTTIYFARYGKYSKPHLWSKEDLARIEQILLARIETVENRVSFDPTPHNGCQYCPFRAECPVMKDNFEVNAETGLVSVIDKNVFNPHGDIYRATKLAGILIQLDELMTLGKDNLREFIKKYEQPVVSGNKAFMYKPSEEIHWDSVNKHHRMDIFRILEKHNVDGRNYSCFSNKSLTPVFLHEENKEEMLKELNEVLIRKAKTTFNCYKI